MDKIIELLKDIVSALRKIGGTSRYKVSAQVLNVAESTTLMPEKKYGAWMCLNTGTAAASVMGYELQPGEGLDFLDAVPAGSSWDTPIQITINAGAIIRITRLQCREDK